MEQVLESSRYLSNLVIKANILGADQAYTFRVEATDSTGTGTATRLARHTRRSLTTSCPPSNQCRLRAG